MEGSHATDGSQRLCCTGSGSPVRNRARSATRNDRRRRHTATEGSRGSAAPEGEPRPTLNEQRDATDGGTLTASEGSLRLCCTGRESPPFRLNMRCDFFFFQWVYYSLSRSFSSFQFLNSSKIAYWLCLRDCKWCTYSYTTINLINPFALTITPVWSVLAGPRSVRSYRCNWNVQCVTSSTAEFNCRIQICFHASPDQTRWAFVILSQPFNVFNHVMLIFRLQTFKHAWV